MKDSEILAVEQILADARPTKSNVDFCFNGITIGFNPPPMEINPNYSEEDMFNWALKKENLEYRLGKEISEDPEIKKSFIDRAKSFLPYEFIGGFGITWRTIAELEEDLPTITESLLKERGKIVFLGNGFSDVPLLVAKRYQAGLVKVPPVVVDIFDYNLVLEDFEIIKDGFLSKNISSPRPMAECHAKVSRLVKAANQGDLQLIRYYVGSGNVPDQIKEASLLINCFGPNIRSIKEQLSMLGKDGELCTSYKLFESIPQTLKVEIESPNLLGFTTKITQAY
jgi:hypothetical protein